MNTPHRKKLRVTVPVTPEVQDAFKRLADSSGLSVGKVMGEWLQDTIEAVESMAELMEKARSQPKLVARQLQGYALGITDITNELMEHVSKRSAQVTPPVSNTGGKLPKKPKTGRGSNA